MIINISTLIELADECKLIDKEMNTTMSDDMNEAVERGNSLIVYMARTGKMLADAKYHLNAKKKTQAVEIIEKLTSAKYSAKIQNALIDSVAKEEQFIVDWIDRLNRTATHQLDWCRTLISKGKEEMRLTGMNSH